MRKELQSEEEKLEGYQALCRGVRVPPSHSVSECKKHLKNTLVNIVDLIDAQRRSKEVKVWHDFEATKPTQRRTRSNSIVSESPFRISTELREGEVNYWHTKFDQYVQQGRRVQSLPPSAFAFEIYNDQELVTKGIVSALNV